MAKGRYLAVSIEPTELRYITSDGKKVTSWGTVPLDPGSVTDGLIVDPKKMSATLSELLKTNKLHPKIMVSSVAGIRSLPRILQLPKLPSKLVREAVVHEAERQMPLPMNEMYVAHSVLKEVENSSQFFVMGMPRQPIENLASSLEWAKPKSYQLDLKSTALARAANIDVGIIVDIELTRIEIVIVIDGVPLITRTMIMTDPEIAHEDRVRRVAAEIDHTVAFHNANQPDHRLEPNLPVILTGKLAADPIISRESVEAFSHPIKTITPSLAAPSDFPSGTYASCIGMAVKAKTKRRSKVSEKKKGRSKGNVTSPALELMLTPANMPPKKSPMKFVLTTLVACVLFSLLFIAYRFDLDGAERTTDLKFQLDSISLQLSDIQKTFESKTAIQDRAILLEEETIELLGQPTSFFESVNTMFDTIPAGVAPTSVSIRGGEISVEGYAATRSTAINYVGQIEETDLFRAVNIASLTTVDLDPDTQVMQFIISIDR